MLRRKSKAQTTAEYAILIGLVIGAVIAMQVYVRRGLQGRIRDTVDYTGNELLNLTESGSTFNFTGRPYELEYLTSQAVTERAATESQELKTGGEFYRGITGEEVTDSVREQIFDYNTTNETEIK